jgi:hypothetical protein
LLDTLSFRTLHFGPGGAHDAGGTYSKYLQDRELEAIVVRPDFYLFGGIRPGEDINRVLEQLELRLGLRQD